MNLSQVAKFGRHVVVAMLLNASFAHAEPTIPVENASGRHMKLVIKYPDGKITNLELDKGQMKKLDLNMPGFYDLSVSDGRVTAVIGRFDLRRELAQKPKVKIVLSATYGRPAKGHMLYFGPLGYLQRDPRVAPLPR